MRKEKIIDIISERLSDYPRTEISKIINEFFEVIKELLAKGIKIEMRGFGTFYTKHKLSKKARNPKTGESVQAEEKDVPYFKPGSIMRRIVKTKNYFKLNRKKRAKRNA
ncbi:MAG: integration host factor subunit beta [Spirochaetes bacterium]|nr:integration host factor subunit beta [Spirochaetota bacterium]